MLFDDKYITLKDGRRALLRSPREEDAEKMIDYLLTVAGETDFLLRLPQEWTLSPDREADLLNSFAESPNVMMIVCFVDGEVAGNCQIAFDTKAKTKHRASVAIALVKKFWNLGIGSAMFGEMIDAARERGTRQLELSFIEGNDRAEALYKKMGFRITAVKPEAFCQSDGSFVSEICMMKKL